MNNISDNEIPNIKFDLGMTVNEVKLLLTASMGNKEYVTKTKKLKTINQFQGSSIKETYHLYFTTNFNFQFWFVNYIRC